MPAVPPRLLLLLMVPMVLMVQLLLGPAALVLLGGRCGTQALVLVVVAGVVAGQGPHLPCHQVGGGQGPHLPFHWMRVVQGGLQ